MAIDPVTLQVLANHAQAAAEAMLLEGSEED